MFVVLENHKRDDISLHASEMLILRKIITQFCRNCTWLTFYLTGLFNESLINYNPVEDWFKFAFDFIKSDFA